MSQEEKPVAAFLLSLVSGSLILVGGLLPLLWLPRYEWTWWRGMMHMMTWWMPWFWFYPAIAGIVSGAVIIIGALALFSSPKQSQIWGALIIIFSLIGLISLGGFLIGSLLGIVGGILAVTWGTSGGKS